MAVEPVAGSPLNHHQKARHFAQGYRWHGPFYHTGWSTPVALVVPPTAYLGTDWGWGVTNSRIRWLPHQFERYYPGYIGPTGPFLPTPIWPSDTTQFGVYRVRGPW